MNESRSTSTSGKLGLFRRLVPMTGRDPDEHGRTSSPLELLFDLTFVVAVGTAASQFAEMVAEAHAGQAVIAFVLAMFAISVAWISFSWFASAFATDDWLYRVMTMLQMVGVVVFSLGLPAMFHSVEEGGHLELRAMVLGYVVMRIAMVLQWWRAARQSPSFHDACMANIRWTLIVQACWIVVAFVHMPIAVVFVAFGVLGALELALPVLTQGSAGGTPWHPHHVAERYGLFAIIVLGEGVVGTVASSSDLLGGEDGTQWTWNAIAVVMAGVGLTFGMWWMYFLTPFGDILVHRRERGYLFGYGHIPLYIGVAAAGAGLHVAGLYLEHHAEISGTAVVLALALPVGLYTLMIYLLHTLLLSTADRLHLLLVSLTIAVLLTAVLLAIAGVSPAVCLLVIMLAPFVTVIGYETVGHGHQRRMLEGLAATAPGGRP
ncbi:MULTISPECIES: low temperature requirement protein A [Streptomyces]|uniref:Membrane protein n=2 Tax=Streptomyces microflavus TaxID=1919 RepID=A0A7J0D3I9_STRMI|nr:MULTISPECIES: low temperature requirement protein A [Streptomyces]MCX4657222.1 low temperature requirement protein A [Streptomyces microflavus]MDX2982109.1 low temperature requirement protein A [Streptomyces sp. NRRL_B-2249]WSS32111.1 low temperature requirement protein A [Streptomyces microflavus]WST19359.1 low temperature requirement protein A [Streptomyces microflavus]GFN09293.1 membrane protein [Streptomyces microflavus]